MNDPHAANSDPTAAPPGLVRNLRALHAPPPFSSAEIEALDDAVLRLSAVDPPARTRAPWRRIALVGSPLAAAAAIALVFVLSRPAADPADLDRDGRITILDAFALARSLDAGQPTRPGWDRNGDGVVNRSDADAIALAAVSLDHFGNRGGS